MPVVYNSRMIKLCDIKDCGRKHVARGLCHLHYKRLNRHGSVMEDIPARNKTREVGSGAITKKGYVELTLNGKKVREHRLVMENILGRELLPNENVHHINGVKHDNRPENLELWVTSQPSGQRVTDLVEWATEVLRLYSPDRLTDTV